MKKYILTLILGIFISGFSISQCSTYQVYESFGTLAVPTQGGTWTQNSMITLTSPVRTGDRSIGFNGNGDFIRTPLISSPGIFSFWYRRSNSVASAATPWSFILETSPNGTTAWTTRATITPTITGTYQQYSIDLGSLGLTNVYVRLKDNRASGAHERYIDDMSWTSTSSAQNTLLPIVGNCSQSVSSQIKIIDMGSYLETYNNNLTQTVTFTVSDPTKLLELNISILDIETNYDYLYVYDGPNTSSPLLATLTGNNSNLTYLTSQSNSAITISFTTDISNIGTWAGFEATIRQILALPIELMSFEGTKRDDYNLLKWSTASEHNNDYFLLERSEDGTNWVSINSTDGVGNSNTKMDYSFRDFTFTNSLNYYRLSQVDFDGASETFNIISIDNSKKQKQVLKIINILGQEVSQDTKGLLIITYTDGTSVKIIN
jgi:hypothetical protein